MQTNTVADSNLTVVNRCKKNHQFQIQLQNVPFLQLSANQVNVKGSQTQVLPVKFDTRNLAPGVYQGTVTVLCLTCSSEPTCTQDREVVPVVLSVTGEPAGQKATPSPTPESRATPPNTPSGAGVPVFGRVAAFSLAGETVHIEGPPSDKSEGTQTRKLWKIKIKTSAGVDTEVFIAAQEKPDLKFCDYIKVLTAHDMPGREGPAVIDSWEKTEKPPEKPPTEGAKREETKPETPEPPKTEPPKTGGSETTTLPCEEGATQIFPPEVLKVRLLDEDQDMFSQIYTDKDQAATAAQSFSDYLKNIAKIGDALPKPSGGGGVTLDFMVKYLEQGGGIIDEVLKGKTKLLGATTFTASIEVGVRDIVATCTPLLICRGGKWVPEKRFGQQPETKSRMRFTKVWCLIPDCKAKNIDPKPGDVVESGEWDAIADGGQKIDAKKAAKAAKDFFAEVANILKKGFDDLQKFKDACK
jgi:hypothetical protein